MVDAEVKQELPVDLLFEILTKLPVKSLCRFLCVSKLWRSVIADPRFVEAHHACSRARPELLILFWGVERITGELTRRAYTCKLDAVGMELHSPDNRDLTQTHCTLVSVQDSGIQRGYTTHQADGLYCLSFPDFVKVWNPTTRETLDIKTLETGTNHDRLISTNHFGFDPVEKKHKVLNILTEYTGKTIGSRVFILEDNRWRTTANACPPYLRVTESRRVICINGIIFSAAFTTDWSKQKLTAFHVRSETFEVISVPEGAEYKRLIEFAGRATLVSCDFYDPGEGITLWMLEDLRKRVWRRKAGVIPDFDLRGPTLTLRGGTPTGELLFTGGNYFPEPFSLLLYNVESGTARRIEVQGLVEDIIHQFRYITPKEVYFHVESLKSLSISESGICSA